MSLYTRKSSIEMSDDRSRNARRTRRSQLLDSDVNSNNVDNDVTIKHNLDLPDRGRRPSADSNSKSPARNRKSRLIENIAANFEKKNQIQDTRSVSTTSRSIPNGDLKAAAQTESQSSEPPRVEDTPSPEESTKKVGPSARRGKLQREKRMLRQKRRSTGVVNPKDIEESEKKDSEKKDHSAADIQLMNETLTNTQTNELSPPSNHTPSNRISISKSETSSVRSGNGRYESSQTTTVKSTYSSARHHGNKPDETSNIPLPGKHSSEVEELRAKLEAADLTIAKLKKDIKVMNNELHELEEENHQLKQDNKMLEDENMQMLRIIRR